MTTQSFILDCAFLLKFGQSSLALTQLLEVEPITPSSKYFNHLLFKNMRLCLEVHMKGNTFLSHQLLASNILISENLTTLKDNRLDIFKKYKKRLLDEVLQNPSNYAGIRFEISIAARLVREKVGFSVPKISPDFLLNDKNISLECTTIQVPWKKGKVDQLRIKIGDAIEKKASKYSKKEFYRNYSTGLLIDATNLYSFLNNTSETEPTEKDEEIAEIVIEKLKLCKFGSVSLFYYHLKENLIEYVHGFRRFDSELISPELLVFLNRYYPFRHSSGDLKTHEFKYSKIYIPETG